MTKAKTAPALIPGADINFSRPGTDSKCGAVVLITSNDSADFDHVLAMDGRGEWIFGHRIVHRFNTAEFESWLEYCLLYSDKHTNFYVLEKGGYRETDYFEFAATAAPKYRYLFLPTITGVLKTYLRFDAETIGFLLNLRERANRLSDAPSNCGLEIMNFRIKKFPDVIKVKGDPNRFVLGNLAESYEGKLEKIGDGEIRISDAVPYLDSRAVNTASRETMIKENRELWFETDGRSFCMQGAGVSTETLYFSDIEKLWRALMEEDDLPTYAARLAADNALQKAIKSLNKTDEAKSVNRETTINLTERLMLDVQVWAANGKKRIEAAVWRRSETEGSPAARLHTYAFKYNRKGDLVMDIQNHFTAFTR